MGTSRWTRWGIRRCRSRIWRTARWRSGLGEKMPGGEPVKRIPQGLKPVPFTVGGLAAGLHVVHEDGAEFEVGAVELAGQWGVVGACQGAPGGTVEGGVAGAALEHHASLHEPAGGQNFEANDDGSRLENGGIDFVWNQRIPGMFSLPVPAREPGTEVDALRVRQHLNTAAAGAWMHRQASAGGKIACAV